MYRFLDYIEFINELYSYIEYPPPPCRFRVKLSCFYFILTRHFNNISYNLHYLSTLGLKRENRFYIGMYYTFMEPILNTYFVFKNIKKQVCPARSLK